MEGGTGRSESGGARYCGRMWALDRAAFMPARVGTDGSAQDGDGEGSARTQDGADGREGVGSTSSTHHRSQAGAREEEGL